MNKPTAKPLTPLQQRILDLVVKPMTNLNIKIYRLTGGRVMGRIAGGPVLLITTIGRKTGLPRTVALLYLRDADRYVIVASKGGMPKHPIWYNNLVANPTVEVEVGRKKFTTTARVANEQEKATLWPKLIKLYSGYQTYQNRTERDIPVVILEPRTASAAAPAN